MRWPRTEDELVAEQLRLAALEPQLWTPPGDEWTIGGCFVCFPRGYGGVGDTGDRAWAGAALGSSCETLQTALATGSSAGPYRAGLLAIREGRCLEAAVRRLSRRPDVLLVNATGLDHPRDAGLAVHLGAMLELPTVGVTHRAFLAQGEPPARRRGRSSPLMLDDRRVGSLLCTSDGCLPLAVHRGWRTDADTAERVVMAACRTARTPEPLRAARRVARTARAASDRGRA